MNIKTGLIVCVSMWMAIVASAQNTNELKVASYNIRMDTDRDGVNAWPNRKDFVKHLIQYHDLDIIGTQEGFVHQIEDLMEIPGYAYYGKGRDDGAKAGEHSAILYKASRFQLLDSGDFWLRENPTEPGLGWDATCCNRICSWAQLLDKDSQKTVYVFNVHFDHQGVQARVDSGKLMAEKIRKIAGDAPAICTGDFNSLPDSPQIASMKTVLQDSYEETQLPPYGPVGTANGFVFTAPLKNRIDYVFVSTHFNVINYAALTDAKNQRYPSDHLPVVAKIQWK